MVQVADCARARGCLGLLGRHSPPACGSRDPRPRHCVPAAAPLVQLLEAQGRRARVLLGRAAQRTHLSRALVPAPAPAPVALQEAAEAAETRVRGDGRAEAELPGLLCGIVSS